MSGSLPQWLRAWEDVSLEAALGRIVAGVEAGGARTLEVSFGRIVRAIFNSRISYGASQSVVLREVPPDCFFKCGIDRKTYDHMVGQAGPGTAKESDTISLHGLVRKTTAWGQQPVYEKRRRTDLCFVHLPLFGYDARVSVLESERVENPDRRPALYGFAKNRSRCLRREGNASVVLEEVVLMGSMDAAELDRKRRSKMDVEYEMRILFDGLEDPGVFRALSAVLRNNLRTERPREPV